MAKHYAWKLIVAVTLAAILVVPGVSATSMVFQSPPPVPPPNDNFSSATAIANLPFSDSVDMTYAATEYNEPQPCNWAQKTIWYSYTSPANQAVKITLSGPYDTSLVIYQAYGPDITNLSQINCNAWVFPLSTTFNASESTTYYFQVGSIYGYAGSIQVTAEPVLPPANDNFADAIVISGTSYSSESVDVTAATTEVGEPLNNCYYSVQDTMWYKFVAPSNGSVYASLSGTWWGETPLNVYRADGEGFGGLSSSLGCSVQNGFNVSVEAGKTYYFQAGTYGWVSGFLYFNMSFTPAPANDTFANVKVISILPYTGDGTDMTAASREGNEPTPSCSSGYSSKTVWYAYTPSENESLSQQTYLQYGWFSAEVAVYTGNSITELQEVACRNRSVSDSSLMTFHVNAGTTYYFQMATNENGWLPFNLQVAEPPYPNFAFYPYDPNVFDNVYFENYSWDPANAGIQSILWDFGDGTTATEPWSLSHRFANDGDYTVNLTVTTPDGRTASTSRTVSVKTYDVAIAKFSVPQSAKVGQTRQIAVGISNKRYPEEVEVQLYKSYPGYGWQWVGSLRQSVPVRSGNRTTEFSFNYTFTTEDGALGKVTFRAVAMLVSARDALPADNEAIGSPPTKVGK
jgi:hypothetical protein